MRHQSLWKVTVTTTPEAEDAVAELLRAILNQPATAYFDVETGVSTITIYLPQKWESAGKVGAAVSAGLKRIRSYGLRIGPGKIMMAKIRREDWAESWKRHFKPIEIREALLIKPSWSRRQARKGQSVIVLDPGLSFGTGHHPTTAFCLEQIVAAVHGRRNQRPRRIAAAKSFLDLGTGSGILAMAAARLGCSPVRALDFDPESVRVARANARANQLHRKLRIMRGDVSQLPIRPGQRGHGYDLVCANLLTDLLIAQRRRIAAQLKPDGTLVLAGILKSEFASVQKAYKTLGLGPVSRQVETEWCSGAFRFDS
jgi:ribosomal protein L11 methyltransferase